MLLNLIPPHPLALPEILQSHQLSPPTWSSRKAGPRQPFAYTRIKRALEKLKIRAPSILVADLALWRTVAVEQVTFDLDNGEILVIFIDGTSESFSLDIDEEQDLSQEYVLETEDEESQKERVRKKREDKSRFGKLSLFATLQKMSMELRDAWEDVSILSDDAGPLVSTRDDFETLIGLAATPSIKIPRRWRHRSSPEEEMKVDSDDQDESNRKFEEIAKLNSQLSTRSVASSVPPPDLQKYSGQFLSRRRANSTSNPSNAVPTSTPSSSYESPSALKPPYDVESFLDLLESTRHALVDIWSREVIPLLKERIPPNFSLFTATNASKWCKMKAINERAKLAKLLGELAVDQGNIIDATDSEAEDSSIDESDSELDEDMVDQHHLRRKAKADREAVRWSKNLLFTLRDDYDLLKWCADAERAARDLEYDGPERAPFVVETWPIERSYVEKSPPPQRATTRSRSGVTLVSSSNSTSSLTRKSSARILTPPTSPIGEATDEEESTDEEDTLHFLETDDFIYPPDPMGYKFLPERLPHAFSARADDSELGPEMKTAKAKILASMSIINGYQKKNLELEEFIIEQTGHWELLKMEQREEIGRGGPRRRSTKNSAIIPLVQQPLRYAAADKSIARRLTDALAPSASTVAPVVPFAPSTSTSNGPSSFVVKLKPHTPRISKTDGSRRKQITNLTLLNIVGTDESSAREALDQSTTPPEKTKPPKKRKRSVEGGSAAKKSKTSSSDAEPSSGVKSIRAGATGKRKSSKEKKNYPPIPYPSKKNWSSTNTPTMGTFFPSTSSPSPAMFITPPPGASIDPIVQEVDDEEMVDEVQRPIIREYDDTGEVLVSSRYDQLSDEEDELADEMETGFETDGDDDMERAPTPELEVDLDASDPIEEDEEEIDELLADSPAPSSPKLDHVFDDASDELCQSGFERYGSPRLGSPALSPTIAATTTLPFPFSPPFSSAVSPAHRTYALDLIAPVAMRPFHRIVASVAGEEVIPISDAPFEQVEIPRPPPPPPFARAQPQPLFLATPLRKHSSLDSIFPHHPSSPATLSPRASKSSAT